MSKEPLKDFLSKVEETVNKISTNDRTEEDVIMYYQILKKGNSLDQQMMQKLVSWPYTGSLKYHFFTIDLKIIGIKNL
ncbi:hypothetical protein [Chryseobacterium luteum]|nr:hypothetical protein [Chryseobacterium luteum]